MIKNILSVIIGLVASSFIIFALEVLGHIIYPAPPDLNLNDLEAIKAFTSTAPPIIFILVILSYAMGSIVGGLIAAAIATKNKMTKAITVGGILMGLGAYNLFMIPHPIWTIIISIFLFIPCSWIGGILGIKFSSKKAVV
jgi:ABC-type Na+ efflux pump permease subunit